MGNEGEQCLGDVAILKVTWGHHSRSMKWASYQMCPGKRGMEETLAKGPKGLCAPESRLSEGYWGRCAWMRCWGALGQEAMSRSLCGLRGSFLVYTMAVQLYPGGCQEHFSRC